MKSDISDDFPIFFSMQLTKEKLREGVIKIKKNCLYFIGDILTLMEL